MHPDEISERRKLIAAIKHWNIAAESEEASRFFYRIAEVAEIESGEASVVIGHKGTGKSAIGAWLFDINDPSNSGRSIKLSLRDFPFEILYDLSDREASAANSYTTLWQYIIISAACSLLKDDPGVDSQQLHYIRVRFREEFKEKPFDLEEIISRGFGISLPWIGGFTFGLKSTASSAKKIKKYSEKVNRFLGAIKHVKIAKPYYIVFDELDEDYYDVLGNKDRFESFRHLMVGLIRAAERLSISFCHEEKPIRPVVLLRKDLYESINFNDMGKLSHHVRDVSWDIPRLQLMLAFRIARSIDDKISYKDVGKFWDQWNKLFDLDDFNYNHCDATRVFRYILNRSYLRPRDFVAFLQVASLAAYKRVVSQDTYPYLHNSPDGIKVVDLVEAEEKYSSYLRQEVRDAMIGIHVGLPATLNAISDIRKKIITYKELYEAVAFRCSESLKSSLSISEVIETLYYFNVIGRHINAYDGLFAYDKGSGRVNSDWIFIVHRGFWKEFNLTKANLLEIKSVIRFR